MNTELLAPAGDYERLQTAIAYGADAVYISGKDFGMRAFAGNFDDATLYDSVRYAHEHNKKVYVTVNIFAKNSDIEGLKSHLKYLSDIGVDAIIVADPAVILLAKEYAPNVPLHLSTQANVTNWQSAIFWYEQGISRIVLARELSLAEIIEIRNNTPTDLELEVFVHGAMCLSYSGRCYLSHYMSDRSANRGECAQPCRWSYSLVESMREGEYFPIEGDDRGTYILNSKDLCLLPYLKELKDAGVCSLKIEGRMKTCYYVATITSTYRRELDKIELSDYEYSESAMDEIVKASHRPFTSGFLFGDSESNQRYDSTKYIQNYDFIGLYLDYDESLGLALIEQRNHFKVGDVLEVMQPGEEFFLFTVEEIMNEEGEGMSVAPHAQQRLYLPKLKKLKPFSMLRRKS